MLRTDLHLFSFIFSDLKWVPLPLPDPAARTVSFGQGVARFRLPDGIAFCDTAPRPPTARPAEDIVLSLCERFCLLKLLDQRASFRACAGLPVEIIPTIARVIHLMMNPVIESFRE